MFKDKFVPLNGLRFHYLDWGTSGRKPMLLLHGGAQTAHSWDEFAAAMCHDYHVLALDQRGHGDSDWAPDMDYTLEAHYSDVSGFVGAQRLKSFVLMGLSMGGLNSIVYVSHNPQRVERLVIVDVGPEVMSQGVENIRQFTSSEELDSFEAFVERAHGFNPRRSLENIRERLKYNLKQLPSGKWTWKYDRRPGRKGGGPTSALWEELPRITCPTLIVRGELTDILATETVERMLRTLPSASTVTIPNAGHSVMGDNPPAFAAAVKSFLNG